MAVVLLDTHAWAWSLTADPQLSLMARRVMRFSETVAVSPISIYEIAQKVRLGKWPAMAPLVGNLLESLERQGAIPAPLTPEIALNAGLLDWSHRDPFDRLLAATALVAGIDLVSADTVFDQVPDLRRIW